MARKKSSKKKAGGVDDRPRGVRAVERESLKAADLWLDAVALREGLKGFGVEPRWAWELVRRHHPGVAAVLAGLPVPAVCEVPTAEEVWEGHWKGQEKAPARVVRTEPLMDPVKGGVRSHGDASAAGVEMGKRVMEKTLAKRDRARRSAGGVGSVLGVEDFKAIGGDEPTAIRWVADHLMVAVEAGEAPDSKAWALLQWARENQTEFWKSVFPRVVPNKDEQAKRSRGKKDPVLSLIDEHLEGWGVKGGGDG